MDITELKSWLLSELPPLPMVPSITISTKEDPVLFTFLEDGGFMIEGNAFIDFMFRDPDKTKDRLVSYIPNKVIDAEEDGDGDE